MAEDNTGLDKQVSSSFDTVPIPQSAGLLPEDADCSQSSNPAMSRKGDYPPGQPDVSQPQMPPHTRPQSNQPPQPAPVPDLSERPWTNLPAESQKQNHLQQLWQQTRDRIVIPYNTSSPRTQRVITMSVPAVLVVLVVLLIQALTIPSPDSSSAADVQPEVTTAGADGKIDWPIPEPYPENLRDPTQFGTVHQGPSGTSELVVKGIVYSSDNPSAVVGDRIAHEGDEVFGARVVKINKDSVEFEADEKRFTQKVQP